jgi:iron(III) transport system substrate-binding protein
VRRGGSNRSVMSPPVGGTVSSVDPIGLLRGAPNREAALAFIDFCLSMEGQKLWNFRPGTPGGPERLRAETASGAARLLRPRGLARPAQ